MQLPSPFTTYSLSTRFAELGGVGVVQASTTSMDSAAGVEQQPGSLSRQARTSSAVVAPGMGPPVATRTAGRR